VADIADAIGTMASNLNPLWTFLLGIALLTAAVTGGQIIVRRFLKNTRAEAPSRFATWSLGVLGVLCLVVAFFSSSAAGTVGTWIDSMGDSSPGAGSTSSRGSTPSVSDGASPVSETPQVSSTPDSPTRTTSVEDPPNTAASARPVPVTTAPVVKPTRAGDLLITIKMGSSGAIGPHEYRVRSTPGAGVDVFDDVGQLSAGCYPSWVLTRGDAKIRTSRNGRCTSGGITMFNFGDSLSVPGSYRLSVSVVTDSGQSSSSFVDFTVS
jgi:hypothetical protein